MKKLLSILLVLAMLCTTLALAACNNGSNGTDSESSGEESVAPPTQAELLGSAMQSFGDLMSPISDVFGLDNEILQSTAGNANFVLSLDELSAMGENMFGDAPLNISASMAIAGESYLANAVLNASGDAVKIDLYNKDGKQYVMFPELYADSVFDYADVAGTEEEPSDGFTSIADDLAAIILKDENITISEDGKTYTVSLDKADLDALEALLEPMMGATEGTDSIVDLNPGEESEPVEKPEPDSAVLVINLVSDTQANMTCTVKSGETVTDEITANVATLADSTVFTLSVTEGDTEVSEFTLTATGNKLTVVGNMTLDGTKFDISLEAVRNGDVCKIDGSVSIIIDMSGALMTIPFAVDGSVGVTDGKFAAELKLDATVQNMLNIGISMNFDFTPAEVTVTLPFDVSDVAKFDSEDFETKMQEVYPGASEMLGYGQNVDYGESLDYYSEDQTMAVRIFENGYAEMYLSDLTYEKDDRSFYFYKGETQVYTFDYTFENNQYVVFGQPCETMIGDPGNEGFIENFYNYEKLFLDVYLTDETHANVSFGHEMNESEDFVLVLPNGNTIVYDLRMSDDGMSITFLGETLYLETYEY